MAILKRESEAWRSAVKALIDGNMISQKEFAQQCGVSGQTVSNWLSALRNPGVPAKRKIMKLIEQSQGRVKKNRKMLSDLPVNVGYKKKLMEIIPSMTENECRKILRMIRKIRPFGK